jgi:hypothetical protein
LKDDSEYAPHQMQSRREHEKSIVHDNRRRSLLATAVTSVAALQPSEPLHWEGQETLSDCGDFLILDSWTMDITATYYWNADGTLNRYQLHGEAADVMSNSVTGKTVSGRTNGYNFFEDVEDTPGVWKHAGLMYHIIVPGAGTVLVDAGLFYMVDGQITYLKGKHQFNGGEYAGLCAALR